MGELHLLQCGDLAGQFALTSQLLLQINSSQIVDQMVVVIFAVLGSALAGLDKGANGVGHFGFQLEGCLQSRQTSPFFYSNSLLSIIKLNKNIYFKIK